jgi:hypothetical protein
METVGLYTPRRKCNPYSKNGGAFKVDGRPSTVSRLCGGGRKHGSAPKSDGNLHENLRLVASAPQSRTTEFWPNVGLCQNVIAIMDDAARSFSREPKMIGSIQNRGTGGRDRSKSQQQPTKPDLRPNDKHFLSITNLLCLVVVDPPNGPFRVERSGSPVSQRANIAAEHLSSRLLYPPRRVKRYSKKGAFRLLVAVRPLLLLFFTCCFYNTLLTHPADRTAHTITTLLLCYHIVVGSARSLAHHHHG